MQSEKQGGFFGFVKADGSPANEYASTNPVAYVSGFIKMFFKSLQDKRQIDSWLTPLIERAILQCDLFSDEVPVPTNWDLSPRNWMVDKNKNFIGFIDYENTSWGILLDSFGVVTHRCAYDKPYLTKAFFEGYGLVFDDVTRQKMQISDVKQVLEELFSGYAGENQRWIECGNKVLHNLKSDTFFN